MGEDKQPGLRPAGDWMRIEIFGHRVRCGLVTEIDKFGTKLCQVAIYLGAATEPEVVEAYGGASIFSASPCTEEYARAYHGRYNMPERLALAPPAEFAEAAPEEEDDGGAGIVPDRAANGDPLDPSEVSDVADRAGGLI